jgi:N-acetylglucosamine malate deacetylase 1
MTMDSLLKAKRILVLAPHPDDETLGCGGTIALCASGGTEVHVVVVSDGSAVYSEVPRGRKEIVETRKKEALDAAAVLGVKQVHFLGFPDGELASFKGEIMQRIERLASTLAPDVVFAPSPLDSHEDHRAVSSSAIGFLNETTRAKLAFYEVYGTLRFNCMVDITPVLAVKEKAVLSYHTSFYKDPLAYAEVIKGLNRFRSLYVGGKGFYEAFWIVDHPLSSSEITGWLTYGEQKEGFQAERDAERKPPEAEAEKEEKIVTRLLSDLATRNDELASAMWGLEDARRQIRSMTGSIFWRAATAFYRGRDWLLPENSSRRKAYDRLVALIKQ